MLFEALIFLRVGCGVNYRAFWVYCHIGAINDTYFLTMRVYARGNQLNYISIKL